jgi:hypothetical protein
MNQSYTHRERIHVEQVKRLPCSVCDQPGPSEAHHIEQSLPYCCISLCIECHRGKEGWHGTKSLWRVRKMDELKALNITLGRLQG